MSADTQNRYRFSTAAQWNTCLFSSTDAEFLASGGGVRPLPPFGSPPTVFAAARAFAPAVTRAGEVLFVDHEHSLIKLPPGGDQLMSYAAPAALAKAERIVAAGSALWGAGDAATSLHAYDIETFTRVLTVDVAPHRVIDVAGDGQAGVFALLETGGRVKALHVDRAGSVIGTIFFDGIAQARAFVYLSQSQRFAVLAEDRQQRIYWFAATGERALSSLATGGMHPCFRASVLGSDSRSRVLVGGAEAASEGGGSFVLMFDGDGLPIDELPIDSVDAPMTGVIGIANEALLVTGQRGLLWFDVTDVVPDGVDPLQCTLLTPVLSAPDRADGRRWLRVDATAQLGAGAALEIAFAATDDENTIDRLNAIAADATLSASARIAAIANEPDIWSEPTTFQGSTDTAGTSAIYSAKLFDVQQQYVWVSVRLTAAATAQLPALAKLDVLYPGLSLIERLPAIYQADEATPGSFLRSFVGVVEATTQDIDARVGAMGSLLEAATAPVEWLNYVARWLGVPWDDGLSETQKRTLIANAAALLKARGTRASLELLLQSLIPGSPPRFRVTDATADNGFAILGGRGAPGSALPSMLGGATMWTTTLDATSHVGCMRLPCADQRVDPALPFAGRVRVEIAASVSDRAAWQPWLPALLGQMMPLTARLQLQWVGLDALRGDRLDGSLALESTPDPRIGNDTVTNVARLPGRGSRLSAAGSSLTTRLL